MSGWASTGFDAMDEADKEFAYDKNSVRDFYIKAPGTKVIVFLDDVPMCFWRHSLYGITHQNGDYVVCLQRNHIEPVCPLCELPQQVQSDFKVYPTFVGVLTVIDCGDLEVNKTTGKRNLKGWTSKKGVTYQFGRKALVMKKGSEKKPGSLPKIRRLKEKRGGSLLGTVWEVSRFGENDDGIGTEWEYMGKIDVSSLESLKAGLVALDGSPLSGTSDPLLKELELGPLDYAAAYQPKAAAYLQKIADKLPKGGKAKQEGGQDGEGSVGEDIPF